VLRRIKVEDLKEGMIFSEPLFFDDGKNRVLGKGHPVSERELSVLKQWKDPFVMTAGKSIKKSAEVTELVEELDTLPDEGGSPTAKTADKNTKKKTTEESTILQLPDILTHSELYTEYLAIILTLDIFLTEVKNRKAISPRPIDGIALRLRNLLAANRPLAISFILSAQIPERDMAKALRAGKEKMLYSAGYKLRNTLSENGTAFLVYNDNAPNEYYILENRKKTHWDAALPGEGLLILHVDYNAARWRRNTVNTTPDHQRCSIFHADNSDGTSLVDLAGDPFPFKDNDSLTLTSLPRASVFNANTDGSENMNKSILNIRRNADGDISFHFRVDRPFVVKGDTLFYESFDRCNGTGGNDNLWGGALLGDEFLTDNAGWQVTHPDTQFGADKCARFGTASTSGILQSPAITIVNGAVITFKAAPWVGEHGAFNLYSSNSGVTFTPSTFNLPSESNFMSDPLYN